MNLIDWLLGRGPSSAPRRVGKEVDPDDFSVPGWRLQQFNPGIAGGWISVTGVLNWQVVCNGWIPFLQNKYRATARTSGWPTMRIVDQYGNVVAGPAPLGSFQCPLMPGQSVSVVVSDQRLHSGVNSGIGNPDIFWASPQNPVRGGEQVAIGNPDIFWLPY